MFSDGGSDLRLCSRSGGRPCSDNSENLNLNFVANFDFKLQFQIQWGI